MRDRAQWVGEGRKPRGPHGPLLVSMPFSWLSSLPQMHSFIRPFIHSCMPVCYKVQVSVLGEVRVGGLFVYEEHTFLGRVGGLSGKASHRR